MLAQLYIGLGQHAKAIQESQRAASVAKKDSDKIEFHFTLGVCHHALGEYKQAITNYQAAMEAQTPHITEKAVSHVCLSFFQKEIAIWMKRNLDKDVNTICVDAEFTPEFKVCYVFSSLFLINIMKITCAHVFTLENQLNPSLKPPSSISSINLFLLGILVQEDPTKCRIHSTISMYHATTHSQLERNHHTIIIVS